MRFKVLALACATLTMGTGTAFAAVPGIATTNTRLHTSPRAGAPIIRRVPQGARLNVLNCADRWCLAEWRGVQGYISQNLMDFPNGSASVDRGTSNDEGTTKIVRRRYIEPEYVTPDDDYPDYPVYNTYGPYYGGGFLIGPGYYGGRYHDWRGGRHWNRRGWDHWGNGSQRPIPPGWTHHTDGQRPFVRPQNPNPIVGNRPAFRSPGMGNHFGGPRPGGPGPGAPNASAPLFRK
jgi:hypothetical protein